MLKDIRHPNCKTRKYAGTLPTTSIIIPFHNEGWTTLLRTVHSIINRTPRILLEEVILVDDKSTRPWLGQQARVISDRDVKLCLKMKIDNYPRKVRALHVNV